MRPFLNLGCGPRPLKGWLNLDAQGDGQQAIRGPAYPLPFGDGHCGAVRASHLLEHFSHRETLAVLEEWVRVLAPGGRLFLAVPDFAQIAEEYLSGCTSWPVQGYVMGGQVDEHDQHRAIFDEGGLREALENLGLEDVRRWESEGDCAALPCSLNLCARKPFEDGGEEDRDLPGAVVARDEERPAPVAAAGEPIHLPPGAVKAVMTLPRLAFTDNLFCAMKALHPLGIALERVGGVFWNQGMTQLLEAHLHDGTRYVLTLDYDSVFERADVLELLRVMETRPEIDALCPIQMRREEDSPLFCTGQIFEGTMPRTVEIPLETLREDTMPIFTGHFGLTVFRVESLRKLPKPWMQAQPDAEGGWGEGRMDADIAFWDGWRKAGLTLHLANRVAIGHIQAVVSWPGRDFHLRNQFLSHYVRDGKPAAEVWR